MKTKLSSLAVLIFSGLVAADSSFAGSLSATCNDYLVATTKEQVLGRELSVTRFTSKPDAPSDSGVPIRETFGGYPQVIIGIDASNSNEPYLVVGESLFRITRSSSRQVTIWIYNAATKTSMPQFHTITTYHLGELQAQRLPRGYFLRISGLSKTQIERLRDGISAQVKIGSSNENWNHTIANLTEGLAKHSDLELGCEDPECDYRYDLFKRAIEKGFGIPGSDQIIETEFYTVDQGSLEELVASAKRSKYVGMTYNSILLGIVGVGTGVSLFLLYQTLAMMTGLPQLPIPF